MSGLALIAASLGYSLVVIHRLLVAAASLIVEHRLQIAWASVIAARSLWSTASVVVSQGLSCPMVCGICLYLWHCKADSFFFFNIYFYLLIWLSQALATVCRIFSCSIWGLSSQTGDQTQTLCIGNMESQPLDHRGRPARQILNCWTTRESLLAQLLIPALSLKAQIQESLFLHLVKMT